jgi:nitrogen fixation NifU-like protein
MGTMYSETVLEHFRHPRNFGPLPSPDIASDAENPLCGDRVRLEVRVADGIIRMARFRGNACAISTAAASLLTERLAGLSLAEAEEIQTGDLVSALDAEIKPARIKCAALPLTALHTGIRAYREAT